MSDSPRKTTPTRTGSTRGGATRAPATSGSTRATPADPEPRAGDLVRSYGKSAPAQVLAMPPGPTASSSAPTSDAKAEPARAPSPPSPIELPLLQSVASASFRPSAVARAAMALSDEGGQQSSRPLWSALPKTELTPVIAAVEADLGQHRAAAARPPEPRRERDERPNLTLLQDGPSTAGTAASAAKQEAAAAQRTRAGYQAAIDASNKLLDAVRAHAAAHASSDDRISLSDMTMIAFADSRKEMAAASAYGAPDPKPVRTPPGQQPHSKVKASQGDVERMLKGMAKELKKELEEAKKKGEARKGYNSQSD